jgi:hypothetical protein
MSEPSTPTESEAASADDIRQHAQAPVEGPDPSDDGGDVPREHTQDPAEG